MPVRRADPGDAGLLSRLGRQTFSETFGTLYSDADLSRFLDSNHTESLYDGWLADPAVSIWILEDQEGEGIGYAMLRLCHLPIESLPAGALELSRIYLVRAAQGGGQGSALLQTVLEHVEQRGRPPLFLSVFSENTGAQRLYARHGFRHVGEYLFEVGDQRDREFIWRRD